MGIGIDAVKYLLGAIQTTFDAVVAPSGGDFTTIQAADDDLDAGAFSLLVKTGTYAGWTTSTDDVYIFLGPGSIITSAITLSGDNVVLVLGPGCDIQGLVTLSGVGCRLLCMNACDLVGVLLSGNLGYFNGGGWDTLADGTTANTAISVTGDDCIAEHAACQTTPAQGNGVAGAFSTGARTAFKTLKCVASDQHGIGGTGAGFVESVIQGCIVLGCDERGLNIDGPRARMVGNYITNAGVDGIGLRAGGDNSLCIGNVIQDPTGDPINIAIDSENCVAAGNRTDGAVVDNSGTSTVAHNDATAF